MDRPAHIPPEEPETPSDGQGVDKPGDAENDATCWLAVEKRRVARYTLLIRAAKLVTSRGQFIAVIRDVSEAGLSLRLFHSVPQGDPIELHTRGGEIYNLRSIWADEFEAGFEFARPVDIAQLIDEVGEFPKRGLRLDLAFPIRVHSGGGVHEGVVENLSQQGARFECDGLFAIDQALRLEWLEGAAKLREVRAKVRWRRDSEYGVVFDDTLSLRDLALLAANLQEPGLLAASA